MTEQSERLWKLPEKKRARLLDPAEAEFIEHGFEGASLNRILAGAKMSKGQAYYYITGKADLYLALCTRDFSPLLALAQDQVKTLHKASDFWADVEKLAGDLVQRLVENEGVSALALTVYGSASAMECLVPLTAQLDTILEDIIQKGQDAGKIRTDIPSGLIRDMLKALARAVDRWFALNAPSLPQPEMAHASRGVFEMIRNLVRPMSEREINA